MIVTSTKLVDAAAQIDGRKYVRESHTDTAGGVTVAIYLAEVGADYDAIMAARASLIEEQLAQEEFNKLLES